MDLLTAKHYEGGNHFDNILIDIASSYQIQDRWLSTVAKKSSKRNILYNFFSLFFFVILKRLSLYEPLVNSGFVNKWFVEFHAYWSQVLGGRPITVSDFNNLYFHYRVKNQNEGDLSWNNPEEHVNNWQAPHNIGLLFHYVSKCARSPFRSKLLFKYLKNNMRVLEYGCSLAPMYRTYREFLNHRQTSWVLADIPNYPFHFTRYICAQENDVKLVTITGEKFDDPLREAEGQFDFIIIQEVFEHLDRPLFVAKYLLERLRPGGLFLFDYVNSEGKGLDTSGGMQDRDQTLQYLDSKLRIIEGTFSVSSKSISTCLGIKK